jgi:hypothetical protein
VDWYTRQYLASKPTIYYVALSCTKKLLQKYCIDYFVIQTEFTSFRIITFKKYTSCFSTKPRCLHKNLFIRCKLTKMANGAGEASDTGAIVRVDAINTTGTILARRTGTLVYI